MYGSKKQAVKSKRKGRKGREKGEGRGARKSSKGGVWGGIGKRREGKQCEGACQVKRRGQVEGKGGEKLKEKWSQEGLS